MNAVLNIPGGVAARLGGDGERLALEGLAVESYRAGLLAKPELRRMRGFATLGALDGSSERTMSVILWSRTPPPAAA